jgi:16S rRNA (cytosine967-C5)-methyltransferase
MTPAARIEAVIELLAEILATPRPADTLTGAYFRARRFIGSGDRRAIVTRLYRIMRGYHRLTWWINKHGVPVDARSFVIASLIFDKELNMAAMENMFSGAQYAPAQLDYGERKLAKALEGRKFVPDDMPLRERTECPEWAFGPLQEVLGDRFETEMNKMMEPAPMDLRVNTLKADRAAILAQLKKEGIDAHAGKISPLSIRVFGRPPIAQHNLYKEGCFEIQDEGSQMVAFVANAQPGEQVADFCAGAGGKTLALGASMQNKGRIVAMDVLGGRLNRAKERFRRAGLHNIETRALTSERDKYVKRHAGHFDLVLVDAPCTGTGTWRRDPDKRWKELGPGLSTLVPLQKSIVVSACRMVKPGGRMVYATCSLLPSENEDQIETFLSANPHFKLTPARDVVSAPGAGDYLKLTPSEHDTDGFFAAVITRDKEGA